jgi:hypothetical protein
MSGHEFLNNPEVINDFSYRSVHITAVIGKCYALSGADVLINLYWWQGNKLLSIIIRAPTISRTISAALLEADKDSPPRSSFPTTSTASLVEHPALISTTSQAI